MWKIYRWFSQLFCLLSPEALRKLVPQIPVKTGICEPIINNMKCALRSSNHLMQKYCILLFDEMALQPRLYFSKSEDIVEGFVDDDTNSRSCVSVDVTKCGV